MQNEFLECVNMIDDDQYVHPNTIGDIFSKRKPQTNPKSTITQFQKGD